MSLIQWQCTPALSPGERENRRQTFCVAEMAWIPGSSVAQRYVTLVTHVTYLTPRLLRHCARFFDSGGVEALVGEGGQHSDSRDGDECTNAV